MLAHADLESITLERDLAAREDAPRAPLRRAHLRRPLVQPAQAGARRVRRLESQQHVTGEVRLELDAGSLLRRRSPRPQSLYDYGLATYDAADRFRHADSEGFVRLWGLGVQTWAGDPGSGGRSLMSDDEPGDAGGPVGRAAPAVARPVRRRTGRRADGASPSACATTGASRSTTSPAPGRTRAGLARGGLLDEDEVGAVLGALDTVEMEFRTGDASCSCRPTRTSTPRSSGGSPSSPARPGPSSTPAASRNDQVATDVPAAS